MSVARKISPNVTSHRWLALFSVKGRVSRGKGGDPLAWLLRWFAAGGMGGVISGRWRRSRSTEHVAPKHSSSNVAVFGRSKGQTDVRSRPAGSCG